jgi:luciferase family oxidoreductase group 1
MPTRFSVLDRSRTRRGRSDGGVLRDTVEFARQIEELGYHRFWVSEHHGVPGVAGSAPTVLAAAVAAATSRIRVGTGGVMLPNHRPLVVAEQFGVLEALHPGRIDMGLGRSVGFTAAVREALGHDRADAERFGEQIEELLGYFTGAHRVRARPAEGQRVPAFVLATGSGGDHAARFGLPLVIGPVRGEEPMLAAIERYRERFEPSPWGERPYVVVSTAVAVAETTERARRLLASEAWSAAWSRTRGEFPPLEPEDDVLALEMTDRERTLFTEAQRDQIAGTAEEVASALAGLVGRSGADEVLVTTSTHDRAALLDSYRRLAALTREPAVPAR